MFAVQIAFCTAPGIDPRQADTTGLILHDLLELALMLCGVANCGRVSGEIDASCL
jgi:hypothetical protein